MRMPVVEFGKIGWFIFDFIFKPLAVSCVVFIERWLCHRVKYPSDFTNVAIESAVKTQIKLGWGGMSVAGFVMQKFVRTIMYFCELDNAYMKYLLEFNRQFNKEMKKRGYK